MTLGERAVRGGIGRTPEARVRWLMAFAAADVSRLSPRVARRYWDGLFNLQSRQPVRVPPHLPTLAETHRTLAAAIRALANGRPYDLWMPGMTWTLRPPVRRPAGSRYSAPVRRESVEARLMREAMPAMAVSAFVDALNLVGADRLRTCPLVVDGKDCGLTFLATRRQEFCSRRHAQAAAWAKYWAKHSVERKLRRS
jgi:hypothetical protein